MAIVTSASGTLPGTGTYSIGGNTHLQRHQGEARRDREPEPQSNDHRDEQEHDSRRSASVGADSPVCETITPRSRWPGQ